jgi:hypothetical protein
MKVIVLDDATWALVTRKLEQELACARAQAELVRGWEKRHKCRYVTSEFIRKRHIEAIRLCRRILSQ